MAHETQILNGALLTFDREQGGYYIYRNVSDKYPDIRRIDIAALSTEEKPKVVSVAVFVLIQGEETPNGSRD